MPEQLPDDPDRVTAIQVTRAHTREQRREMPENSGRIELPLSSGQLRADREPAHTVREGSMSQRKAVHGQRDLIGEQRQFRGFQ